MKSSPFLSIDIKISTYYKVLPTDPSFQDLNIFQKLVLLYAIGDDEKSKIDLISAVLNRLSMQINPYVADVPGVATEPPLAPDEHYNAEYERQVKSASETGFPDLSPLLRHGIDAIYGGKNVDGFVQVSIDGQNITPQALAVPKSKTGNNSDLG